VVDGIAFGCPHVGATGAAISSKNGCWLGEWVIR